MDKREVRKKLYLSCREHFGFEEFFMNLQEIDFNELELREIGSWPLAARIGVIIVSCIAVVMICYLMFIRENIEQLNYLRDQQILARKTFKEKHHEAINLDAYEKQMHTMQDSFLDLLQQLPSEQQIPALMEDISMQAAQAGLELKLIKPEESVDKGFYKELPIKMSIEGTYNSLGMFFSGIAELPRVVTFHDFKIGTKTNQMDILTMDIDAKTYWYNNSGEKL